MRSLIFCVCLMLPGLALALPGVEFTGSLTKDGAGIDEPTTLEFRVYESEEGGEALWTETHEDVDVSGGVFKVLLFEDASLTPEMLARTDLFVAIVVGDELQPLAAPVGCGGQEVVEYFGSLVLR